MRTLILLLVLLPAPVLFAQGLTVAEVYDYQPGDVFQVRGSLAGGPLLPPEYRTDLIQQRYYSTAADSLFYVTLRTVYRPPTGPTFPAYYAQYVDTLAYTGLDQPATHFTLPDPCGEPSDSIGTGTCGYETWVSYTTGDTCFEPDQWTSSLVRGCGGPYFWAFQPQGLLVQELALIYVQKGGVPCGELVTGVPEDLPSRRIHVFPNPAKDLLFVAGATGSLYDVSDLDGRRIASGTITNERLNVEGLPPGIYLLRLRAQQGNTAVARFVVE